LIIDKSNDKNDAISGKDSNVNVSAESRQQEKGKEGIDTYILAMKHYL